MRPELGAENARKKRRGDEQKTDKKRRKKRLCRQQSRSITKLIFEAAALGDAVNVLCSSTRVWSAN